MREFVRVQNYRCNILKGAPTVGELAQRSGVAVSALHIYEARGLIRSSRRPGNQRRYRRELLRRESVIKVAQRVGVPLAEIQEALKAGRGSSSHN